MTSQNFVRGEAWAERWLVIFVGRGRLLNHASYYGTRARAGREEREPVRAFCGGTEGEEGEGGKGERPGRKWAWGDRRVVALKRLHFAFVEISHEHVRRYRRSIGHHTISHATRSPRKLYSLKFPPPSQLSAIPQSHPFISPFSFIPSDPSRHDRRPSLTFTSSFPAHLSVLQHRHLNN
ncbi:hypothetical protein BD410DRAFT_289459 [Rickenella mellea]|uniref:Uncharacterized protein n=1 Tax=Rickenella mellea TaxID=50990 RepID=A0A4Y7Q2S2_9AGAM|nr:hypothetical protein BD410DRAFT_289459 [Rickenella mellea]